MAPLTDERPANKPGAGPQGWEVPSWDVPSWQLPLAQLCDSALPTGAFSHSLGLETYVLEGHVHDEACLLGWLTVLVQTQLTCADALAIREAARALDAGDLSVIFDLDRLLFAQALPGQTREATVAMGARTLAIAQSSAPSQWLERYAGEVDAGRCHAHPALVLALVGTALGAPPPAVIAAHLFSVVTTLTQNGVRAIPLGQNAGQRVLAAIRPVILDAVARAGSLSFDHFGEVAIGLEMAQMRHERVHARMFMS